MQCSLEGRTLNRSLLCQRKYVRKSDTTSQYFAHTQCTHSTCVSHPWTSWLFICFMLRLKSSNRLSVQRLVQLFDIWFRHLLTDRVMHPRIWAAPWSWSLSLSWFLWKAWQVCRLKDLGSSFVNKYTWRFQRSWNYTDEFAHTAGLDRNTLYIIIIQYNSLYHYMKTTPYEQTGFANMLAPAVLRLSVLTSLSTPCNLDGSSHSLDRTTGDEKRHRGGSGPSLELPPPLFPIDNHYRDRDGSCRARWKIWIGNGLMNNLESFEMFKFHKDVKAHIRG